MSTPQNNTCPHCGDALSAFEMPDDLGWEHQVQHACFNDECPYFVKGWDWMWENYRTRASYRYRITDASSSHASPLPVWSKTALKDRIVKEDG